MIYLCGVSLGQMAKVELAYVAGPLLAVGLLVLWVGLIRGNRTASGPA